MNDAAKRIVEYMGRHGLNQAEMAKRLAVSQPTLCNWLEGTHGITKKNLARIKFICGDWEPVQRKQETSDSNSAIRAAIVAQLAELDGADLGKVYSFIAELKAAKFQPGTAADSNVHAG